MFSRAQAKAFIKRLAIELSVPAVSAFVWACLYSEPSMKSYIANFVAAFISVILISSQVLRIAYQSGQQVKQDDTAATLSEMNKKIVEIAETVGKDEKAKPLVVDLAKAALQANTNFEALTSKSYPAGIMWVDDAFQKRRPAIILSTVRSANTDRMEEMINKNGTPELKRIVRIAKGDIEK